MSLRRLVLRDGAVGGGSALVGWAASECLGLRNGVVFGLFGEALTCGLIGGAIAAGMTLVACRDGRNRWEIVKPAVAGLAAGGFAGAIGMSVGHALLGTWHGGRALGWALLGAGIGAAEGLYARSAVMLRQGALAAAIGGLAGGLPFGAIYALLSGLSDPGSRAAAFILLGSCVGAAIGLTSAVFARAWLTVVDGGETGARVPLAARTVTLGRAAGAALRFNGRDDAEVEREHVRIAPQPDGRYALEDMHTRHGTRINRRRALDRVLLEDGDLIQIGRHSIRFDDRKRRATAGEKPRRPIASPEPVAQPKTDPVAAKPSRPVATNAAKRPPTAMSACPKCNRPVPGTRPYCVFCKISF